jgi:hypothetical protein
VRYPATDVLYCRELLHALPSNGSLAKICLCGNVFTEPLPSSGSIILVFTDEIRYADVRDASFVRDLLRNFTFTQRVGAELLFAVVTRKCAMSIKSRLCALYIEAYNEY